MAKPEEKRRARALRRDGWSIGAIANEVGISRASASVWCRDIALTEKQVSALQRSEGQGRFVGQMKGAAANRLKKEKFIEACRSGALREIRRLSHRDLMLVGLGIYWGEGSKAEKNALAVTNSDPRIIIFMSQWFQKIFKISSEMFAPQIFINESHRERNQVVCRFWERLLEIPPEQFRKTVFIRTKNKKIYENHDSYYGVLALRVRKGTNVKYKILGYLDALGAYFKAGVAQW